MEIVAPEMIVKLISNESKETDIHWKAHPWRYRDDLQMISTYSYSLCDKWSNQEKYTQETYIGTCDCCMDAVKGNKHIQMFW